MRVLMLSKDGDGLGIGYKLSLEGNQVDVWVKDQAYRDNLKGILGRPTEWRPLLPKADLVICDMVGFSQHEELFRKMGKPVLCCNQVADALELDRKLGLATFKRCGIGQPEYWEYSSAQECEASLEKVWNDGGLVLKACGNLDVGKTYVVEDLELARWALSTIPPNTPMVVQRKVCEEDAVEVSTEGWFNGREFITPFNHTWEEKRFMAGDVGKMTGCMGNVVLACAEDRLVRETLRKLEPVLRRCGYRGPLDINCLVTKERVYALEMTARFGYDAIEALMQGLREPVGNLLFETATGVKREMDITSDFMMAIRVTRDPYPAARPQDLPQRDRDSGMPVMGLTAKDMDHVVLCDVQLDGSVLRYCAGDGVLLKATSFGTTVKTAKNRAMKVVQNIKAIDIAYRIDIGDRVDSDLAKLREWGWLA